MDNQNHTKAALAHEGGTAEVKGGVSCPRSATGGECTHSQRASERKRERERERARARKREREREISEGESVRDR